MAMIYPGNLLFGDKNDVIYDLLGFLDPGLCLDVGAAAGLVTRRIAKVPGARVMSFEPFDGNIEHFQRNAGGYPNVSLVRKAVANFDGDGRLFVSATLHGTERGWEDYAGYSSSGVLISENDPRWEDARAGEVSVCSVDGTIAEHVRLMKIDVQGGELDVLHGARQTMQTHGIDMIYVEFEGDGEVIRFLDSKGYILFDSGIYVYSPKAGSPPPEAISSRFEVTKLSSGREVFKGPLTKRPLDTEDFIAFVNGLGSWALQTDLVAVHQSYLPEFLAASARWMQDDLVV